MAFWSTEKFALEQGQSPIVSDFDKERLEHGRYYMRLDREFLVTPDGSTDGPLSCDEKCVRIPPGQFALLFTLESVTIPANTIGFISVRTPEKIKGLINVSGFHVDPGFKGHLKFSVYNAGNSLICLDFESRCFLLWLSDLDRSTEDTWDKKNKFAKNVITAKDREQMCDMRHSPAALHNRLKKMEEQVSAIVAVGVVIVFPLLLAFGVTTFEHWFGEKTDKVTTGGLVLVSSLLTSFVIVGVYAIYRRFIKK
jgi:dCTP deaminase